MHTLLNSRAGVCTSEKQTRMLFDKYGHLFIDKQGRGNFDFLEKWL